MQTSESDVKGYIQFSDEALLLQVSRRNSEALAALYDRHAQAVYNLILRIVREGASADEILQDTFWQVWQKADTYQQGNAAAWLYRIARNKSLDWLRRQKTLPPSAFSLDAQEGAEAAGATAAATRAVTMPVEQTVAQSWQQEHVQQALHNLPPEQRQCLELAFFEGLSQRQIAEFTQTPVSTVKTRIQMAMDKLERVLRSQGYRSGKEGGS
jgi:RNA polymerase sigma-70 factor (ECF subfamily)